MECEGVVAEAIVSTTEGWSRMFAVFVCSCIHMQISILKIAVNMQGIKQAQTLQTKLFEN